MRIRISPGDVETTVDLTSQGGDEFLLVAAAVLLGPTSTLEVACPADGGACIADAVLVESAARYNDGSQAASVTLQPFDGIILRKTPAPPSCAHA